LTPPSCQSKTAFIACFAARLLEVCLRSEYSPFLPPNPAFRILFAIRCAWLHRQLRSTRRPQLLRRPGMEQ
jgi:hypothetical protein